MVLFNINSVIYIGLGRIGVSKKMEHCSTNSNEPKLDQFNLESSLSMLQNYQYQFNFLII